jgi:cyclohexa-1,5-dienecarbonyl-CoA hydratase
MATQPKSEFQRVRLSADPPLAQITLNHLPQNVIDIPMMEELAAALSELEARPEISTVVFSGNSRAFSAGVDVAAHTPNTVREMLAKFHAVIRSVVNSKKVSIAVVRGNCLGGGAEMAMVCDIVLTARDAKWAFPEIKLACFPPVAVTALAALVGQKRAAELVLTGRQISGSEAAVIGLANYALNDDDLPALLQQELEQLSKLSPQALAVTKKAAYAWDAVHFEKGLARAEQIYLDELMKTADAQEGIRAWLEKREAKWQTK